MRFSVCCKQAFPFIARQTQEMHRRDLTVDKVLKPEAVGQIVLTSCEMALLLVAPNILTSVLTSLASFLFFWKRNFLSALRTKWNGILYVVSWDKARKYNLQITQWWPHQNTQMYTSMKAWSMSHLRWWLVRIKQQMMVDSWKALNLLPASAETVFFSVSSSSFSFLFASLLSPKPQAIMKPFSWVIKDWKSFQHLKLPFIPWLKWHINNLHPDDSASCPCPTVASHLTDPSEDYDRRFFSPLPFNA